MLGISLITVALGIISIAFWRWKTERTFRVLMRIFAIFVAIELLLLGGYILYVNSRRPQGNATIQVAPGIQYVRKVLVDPRPIVAHFVMIDTDEPGLSFQVTHPKPTGGRSLASMTTSQFARATGCLVAINGGFFRPWHDDTVLDYYPHRGDSVDVIGQSIAQGVPYGTPEPGWLSLCFDKQGHPTIGEPDSDTYVALPGREAILIDGEVNPSYLRLSHAPEPQPRTVVGIDRQGKHLILLVIDGRQPGYSEGATLPEAGKLLLEANAWSALHLDGGGSSTLVINYPQRGKPVVQNSPIHGRIPGRERPVGNHLGVFSSAAASQPMVRKQEP